MRTTEAEYKAREDPRHWGRGPHEPRMEYDGIKDQTVVTQVVKAQAIAYVPLDSNFTLMTMWRGRGSCAPEDCANVLLITLNSTTYDGWFYLKAHDMALASSETRLAPETDHDGTIGRGYVIEHVSAILSMDDLRALLASDEPVLIEVGISKFELDRGDIAAFLSAAKAPSETTSTDLEQRSSEKPGTKRPLPVADADR